MTDQLIAAWLLAADEDFGGSLDTPLEELRRPERGRTPASGIPYCYRYKRGYQVKIPGVRSRCFPLDALDAALEFVQLHVDLSGRKAR